MYTLPAQSKLFRIFSGFFSGFFGDFWHIFGFFGGLGEVLEGPGTISDDFGQFWKFDFVLVFLMFFGLRNVSLFEAQGPGPGRPR